MKLTEEVKNEIDGFTFGKLASLFRFHPCEYTTGETGKYTIKKLKEKLNDPREKSHLRR